MVKKTFGDLKSGDYIFLFNDNNMLLYKILNISTNQKRKSIVFTIEDDNKFVKMMQLPSIVNDLVSYENDNGTFITPNIREMQRRIKQAKFDCKKKIDQLDYYYYKLESSLLL